MREDEKGYEKHDERTTTRKDTRTMMCERGRIVREREMAHSMRHTEGDR